jgi:hypothetical protein
MRYFKARQYLIERIDMDTQMKKLIGNMLILCGVAVISVIIWEYVEYLLELQNYKDNKQDMPSTTDIMRGNFTIGSMMNSMAFPPSWHWTEGEVLKIIGGVIAIGTGFSLKGQANDIDKIVKG